MRRLLALVAVAALLFGCQPDGGDKVGESDVRYFHDAERGVSCWSLIHSYGVGISCLPDSELVR